MLDELLIEWGGSLRSVVTRLVREGHRAVFSPAHRSAAQTAPVATPRPPLAEPLPVYASAPSDHVADEVKGELERDTSDDETISVESVLAGTM